MIWKKNRFLFILIIITLVLAIAVTGLGWPGYLLRFVPKDPQARTEVDNNALLRAQGNSRAFSVEPLEGIKISAPENALDKDRTFKMQEASEEEQTALGEAYSEVFEEPAFFYKAWELDAGLEDDELLPGTFTMSFDLAEFGLDEELYDDVTLYRVDDSGTWYRYGSRLEGSCLVAESRQNSVIIMMIGCTALFLGGAAVVDAIKEVTSGAYVLPGLRQKTIDSYDLSLDDGKGNFKIIIKIPEVRELLFFDSDEGKAAVAKAQKEAITQALTEVIKGENLSEEVKNHCYKTIPSALASEIALEIKVRKVFHGVKDKLPDGLDATVKRVTNAAVKKSTDLFLSLLENTDEYLHYNKNMQLLTENKDKLEKLRKYFKLVDEVAQDLSYAYFFLKDQAGVKMPIYTMEVHISDKKNSGAAGQVVPPFYGHPYMVIYAEQLASGRDNVGSDYKYDELLLTMTHEMFHAVQREYISKVRAHTGFDEMMAQVIEWDACEYFSGKKIITTDGHNKNLEQSEYFAIELDSYSTLYFADGFIGTLNPMNFPDVYYPRAPFARFLMKTYGTTYDQILTRYAATVNTFSVTNILINCFQESKAIASLGHEGLTFNFHKFAESYQKKFLEKARNGDNAVFSPDVTLNGENSAVTVNLEDNHDYTIRVRRVKAARTDPMDKQYAILLIKSGDLQASDVRITPLDQVKDKDYVELKDGLFIRPKNFPADTGIPSDYLMESDGGTTASWRSAVVRKAEFYAYTLYLLTPLKEPEMETKSGILHVKELKRSTDSTGATDRIVASITLGNKTLKTEDKAYDSTGTVKNWKIDLNDLTVDGKALTSAQKKELKITFRECVTGTWNPEEPEKACLGPGEEFMVPRDFDITGTYRSTAVLGDFSLGDYAAEMVGGMASAIAGMLGEEISDEDLQSAVDDSVEFSQESVTLEQTIVIESAGSGRYNIKISSEIGELSYEGTLGDDRVLAMNLIAYQPAATSDGLDVTDDVLSNITLTFHQDEEGEAYIDGSCEIRSSSMNATYTCTGRKDNP